MPTRSEYQEKIDVLDIIISILKDHEENLSRLADRFDALSEGMSGFEEKVSTLDRALERLEGLKVQSVIGAVGLKGPLVVVKCKDWLTFRTASQGALLVAFEVEDNRCVFYSVSDLFIFTYSEASHEIMLLIDRGVRRWIRHHRRSRRLQKAALREVSSEDGQLVCEISVSRKLLRQWLFLELGVSEEKIIEGRVLG